MSVTPGYGTDWEISTDIYDIVKSVNDIKKRFVEEEDEDTLAVGIFGFLGDTEAKKIQTAVVTAGVLGNEMFPQRSKLDKNVITHAMYCNVDKLQAVPAHLLINMAIKESDFDNYAKGDEFRFDRNCPIYIDKYEFHFDYDVVIKRTRRTEDTPYIYNAQYDMKSKNIASNIRDPYLRQPYRMNFQNDIYIFFQAMVRQITIETTMDKMITSSIIDNKSFTFTFDNQMVVFDVYIEENGKTTRLLPLLYGSTIEPDVNLWCNYLYINDHTIRVGFDQTSFLPGLNASIKVVAQTTTGSQGNFRHKIDIEHNTFFIEYESALYNYKKLKCFVACASDSTDGEDRKTIDRLKELVPKFALSRGYITTETDLNNYFNLISTDQHRLKLQKKVDNQLNRIWYCYLLMKDMFGNVIPTNSINLRIDPSTEFVFDCEQEEHRQYIPAGTVFRYNKETDSAIPIKESDVPEIYSKEYYNNDGFYYYRTMYTIIINSDPLYAAYYMPIVNVDGYFEYQYVNPNMYMGFVVNSNHFERYLLSNKQEYRLSFSIQQSIMEDLNLYYEKLEEKGEVEIVNNMRIFLVIYQDGDPYRYEEMECTNFDKSEFISDWIVRLKTDDDFDSFNRLKLLNLMEPGHTTRNYGYFGDNCKASIYIYAKFDQEYGRDSADKLIPGMEGWSLVNIYNLADGLTLFHNFTKVMNTRIRENVSPNKEKLLYEIFKVPLVGEHHFINEDYVIFFLQEIMKKRAYIDYCLLTLENNMDIDFKYFNTYGPSVTYHEADRDQTTIGDIDTQWRFRVKLRNNNDIATKKRLISYVKDYVENLNTTGEDLHIPNLLHDVKEDFGDLIIYFEFMNFNENRLGVNHVELRDVIDPKTVPEFICIRNIWNDDKTALIPNIDVEVVKQ